MFSGHTASFKIGVSKVQDLGNCELSPMLIAYAQKPPLNTHVDVFTRVRGLNFSLSLSLHPNCVLTNGKGSGESAH